MRVIKKINNNVAICVDGNGKELIAFGKGIGFPPMPYDLTDLKLVDRTFYNINERYLALLNDIPLDIIEFTAKMVIFAGNHLTYTLNPNLVLTLADHISFAMEREKKHIYIRMPLAYDMEQTYPDEMEISSYILRRIYDTFHIKLNQNEAAGIAMAIVCARMTLKEEASLNTPTKKEDDLLEGITEIIEGQMHIQVNRKSFNYARYATHVQYLLQRLHEHKSVDSDNMSVYKSLQEEFSEVSDCVNKIEEYLQKEIHRSITEEEKIYLILHVNRICAKEGL